MNDPLEWYYDIPIISRLYLTGAILTTTACALDLVSPFSLYFNFNLIFFKGQVRVCICIYIYAVLCVIHAIMSRWFCEADSTDVLCAGDVLVEWWWRRCGGC